MQKVLEQLWKGWELKELLGEGAYGRVYRIEKEEFGHTYVSALKIISIPKSQAEIAPIAAVGIGEENVEGYLYSIVEDLSKEFALMAKVRGHSHIVSYEDHGVVPFEEGIGWYLCVRMELLTPLLQYEKEHPLREEDVVRMGIEICKGLEACENYNIVHRDIKPENVFVNHLGQFKIGDFGVAKQMEKTSQAFSRKGTISFMAPEVFKGGKGNRVSDLYSLGMMLYLFLNHHRFPFYPEHPNPIRYADKRKADSMRLSGVMIPLPVGASKKVGRVLQRACAYEPEERFQHASEMKQALESGNLLPKQATKPDSTKEAVPAVKRKNKLTLKFTVLFLLLASSVLIGATTIGKRYIAKKQQLWKENTEMDREDQKKEESQLEQQKVSVTGEDTGENKGLSETDSKENTDKSTTEEKKDDTDKSTTEEKKDDIDKSTVEEKKESADKDTTEEKKKSTTGGKKKNKKEYEESIDSWDLIN